MVVVVACGRWRDGAQLELYIFVVNDAATTENCTPSRHDALPTSNARFASKASNAESVSPAFSKATPKFRRASGARGSPISNNAFVRSYCAGGESGDRKSRRVNSSHSESSYAVFCLKKKPNSIPTHIVPRSYTKAAKALIEDVLPRDKRVLLVPRELAIHPDVLTLFNQTRLKTILETELGPFPEVISSQVAVTPAFDSMGGRPSPHVDGSWSGAIPDSAAEIEPLTGRPLNPIPYFGENDDRRGSNDGQLWQDPDRTISLGSYSALVGVALNDQSVPGRGQFAVLKGMHETVESAFRLQRDTGGVIGPEGPDWPRIKATDEGRTYVDRKSRV